MNIIFLYSLLINIFSLLFLAGSIWSDVKICLKVRTQEGFTSHNYLKEKNSKFNNYYEFSARSQKQGVSNAILRVNSKLLIIKNALFAIKYPIWKTAFFMKTNISVFIKSLIQNLFPNRKRNFCSSKLWSIPKFNKTIFSVYFM